MACVVLNIMVKKGEIGIHTKLLLGEYKGNKSHSFSWSENLLTGAQGWREIFVTLFLFVFGPFEGMIS